MKGTPEKVPVKGLTVKNIIEIYFKDLLNGRLYT